MSTHKQTFLYFLTDKNNKSYVLNDNGSVTLANTPVPLVNKPIGWQDLELSFDTVDKYFSNVKALSVPLQYVLDGAEILRFLLYKGKGYEEEVYCTVLKLNSETGIHELEYYAKLDLTKAIDDPEIGVTVNAKEGGFQSDLDANEDVSYEFTLEDDSKGALNVVFDGIDLQDTYNYSIYQLQTGNGQYYFTVPIVYLNNEGDSVGVLSGGQSYEQIGDTIGTYPVDSSNYPFQTLVPITNAKIEGQISVTQIGIPNFLLKFRTSSGTDYSITTSTTIGSGNTHVYDFSFNVNLQRGDKIFLIGAKDSPDPLQQNALLFNETTFKITFTSRNANTQAFCYQPLTIANLLVKKWNAKYSVESNWLTAHNNIVVTSGQALRNLPKPVLTYSFSDFWQDYNTEYCLCLNIIGNVMYIEKREQRFSSNTANIIFDLGFLSNFTLSPIDKNIVNVLHLGWPDQTYDERNGKYEFNSLVEEKAPVSSKKGELNLVSKSRGDAYGAEFIRGKLNNKETTDNKGDTETFLFNIEPGGRKTDSFGIDWVLSTKVLKLVGQAGLINLFPNGTPFETVTPYSTTFNNYVFTVFSATVNGADLDIVVNEVPPATLAFFPGYILFPSKLKRVKYIDITGVPVPVVDGIPRSDVAGAPYNIEEMTPARRLKYWGSWLRSVLFQLPGEKITFQTAQKNADLKTIQPGLTIAERSDTQVSRLDAPFFLNYAGKFTVKVPFTFSKVMATLNSAALVRGIVNGFMLNFLPVGKMSSKPATNDAQEWELTLSANNDLETLYLLSQEGIYISDGMNNTLTISILNPVHYVYYNKALNTRYKYKDLFDDWVHHRNDQFAVHPAYTQKWEFTDTIRQQFISVGLSQIDLYLYDCKANEIDVIQSTIITNQAVRSPYVLLQIDLDPSTYDEGLYVYVLKSGPDILLISEWQYFAQRHEGTYLHEYSHSRNKLNAYWSEYKPSFRVEAMWDVEKFDGLTTDYVDETRRQSLDFDIESTHSIRYGDPYGIPEWAQMKLNAILRLDQCFIEGTLNYAPSDAKWEITQPNGYPLRFCTIDLKRSNKMLGVSVTSTGTQTEPAIIYTIESEAFGQSPGITQIEVQPG